MVGLESSTLAPPKLCFRTMREADESRGAHPNLSRFERSEKFNLDRLSVLHRGENTRLLEYYPKRDKLTHKLKTGSLKEI